MYRCMLCFQGVFFLSFFVGDPVFPSRSAAEIFRCTGMLVYFTSVCCHGDVGTRRGGSVSDQQLVVWFYCFLAFIFGCQQHLRAFLYCCMVVATVAMLRYFTLGVFEVSELMDIWSLNQRVFVICIISIYIIITFQHVLLSMVFESDQLELLLPCCMCQYV